MTTEPSRILKSWWPLLCCCWWWSSSSFVSSQFIPDVFMDYANAAVERDFVALLARQQQQQQQRLQQDDGEFDGADDGDDDENEQQIDVRELQDDDIAFCYDALYLADLNKDSRVDADEFVTFVQIMGPAGFLPDAETFEDLPLILQSNFIILACLCLQIPGSSPQCCTTDPFIDNTGTWPGQVPTPPQQQYLYQVCFLTETSIDRVMASQTPTTAPVEPSAPTTPPASLPTAPDTDAPTVVTEAPTVSMMPTGSPVPPETGTPTASPGTNETMVPTVAPTAASNETTVEPTGPTMGPTPSPTAARPTLRPPPTRAPTGPPTTVPPVSSDQVATVNYEIAVRNGNVEAVEDSSYIPYLIESMNVLAQIVQEEWNADQLVIEEEGDVDDTPFSRMGDGIRRFLGRSAPELFSLPELRPRNRRLAVSVDVALPTEMTGSIQESCPSFVPQTDVCQNIGASIPLVVSLTGEDASDPSASDSATNSYQEQLGTAIQEGRLQDILQRIDPDSPVYVTTGASSAPAPSPDGVVGDDDQARGDGGDDGLGVGAIAGIVVGALAVVALAALFITYRRGGWNSNKDDDDEILLKDAEGKATAEQLSKDIAAAEARGDVEIVPAKVTNAGSATYSGQKLAPQSLAAVSGFSQKDEVGRTSSPGKKKKSSSAALYEVPGAKNMGSDEGSSVSESGWSSNQDLSSIDSKSLDSGAGPMYVGGGIGGAAALAGAAAAAGVDNTESSSSRGNTGEDLSITPSRDYSADMSLQSTYSELDEAIQKGDWAAVGVTAALLASQSQDDSTSGSRPKVGKKAALNPQRAAELDALVEAGDWEGVVAAAARFDAQEALRGESSVHSRSHESPSAVSGAASISSTGTGPSYLSTSGTLESATSPSIFTAANTATSDTASTRSKARKLNEIREEVEALVNAVVPEEADNVDEMMTQFRGREEELVETLRSMQERQVAQKARLESQKQAKRDAKAYVENKNQFEKFQQVDNTGSPADDEWMAGIEGSGAANISALSSAGDAAEKSEEAMKAQLKQAIENEDWAHVAEAAAGLSGHEIFQDDDTGEEALEVASTSTGRSLEINYLVDKGDWDGVVAAASRYVEADSRKSGEAAIEERRKKRHDRLKEEEEALAQAEIWDAIAQQTRAENEEEYEKGSNAGANLAAAWAIDRSLNALNNAEGDGSDRKSDDGEEV